MWPLQAPSLTARETFTTSISKVASQSLRVRLVSATDYVVAASDAFDAAAREGVLLGIAPHDSVADVTGKEMEDVYTQRFAAKDAPGRDFYDAILAAPKHRMCPFCGHGRVSTLDHYLPKTQFPALAVSPVNLIPSCKDCNWLKRSFFPTTEEDVWIHPYYENLEGGCWLRAEVLNTKPSSLRYYVDPPASWSAALSERVKLQFRRLELADLYASQAGVELVNIRHGLNGLYQQQGSDVVRADLLERVASRREARINSWQTAAYEAWSGSDWFCDGGFL